MVKKKGGCTMSHALLVLLILVSGCGCGFANPYEEAVQNALNELQRAKSILGEFDTKTLPGFEANPKEQAYKPTQRGELEQKGYHFLQEDREAGELGRLSQANKESALDDATKEKARQDLENTLNDPVACHDGSCITTPADESHDFAEGAVQMGALNGVAQEAFDTQAQDAVPALFKAYNSTCRVVYKTNRFNYCNQNQDGFGSHAAERDLHKAQREGRAIIVSFDTYCAEYKRILGHKTCVEKRQSWCVFPSKLAKIIQVEARRQWGINFGFVGGAINAPDCRGLTPNELSAVAFDNPSMQQALNELTEVFTSKQRLPSPSQITTRAEEQVKVLQGGVDE